MTEAFGGREAKQGSNSLGERYQHKMLPFGVEPFFILSRSGPYLLNHKFQNALIMSGDRARNLQEHLLALLPRAAVFESGPAPRRALIWGPLTAAAAG